MANQFTDIKIIEANRLHSEEAKGGNNENYSLWTNNLQDIMLLEPGDKVSVYGAFISERGAGQAQSVEIKGVPLGKNRTFSYTNLSQVNKPIANDWTIDNPEYNLPSGFGQVIATENSSTIPIRDDTLNFVMNYWIPSNAHNCLHLPRCWMFNATTSRLNYTIIDSNGTQGRTKVSYNLANTTATDNINFWLKDHFYRVPGTAPPSGRSAGAFKPKNDNQRYTIMIRNKTYFTEQNATDNLPNHTNDMRDPENAIYYTYKELKTIQIPSGFNSAEFISAEITRQLQKITKDVIQRQADSADDNYPLVVARILESETYKAFNVGNIDDMSKANFDKYFNLTTYNGGPYNPDTTNASGFEWLRQYQIIACKYPEIYETGRLINVNFQNQYLGISGGKTYSIWTGNNEPLVIDQEYNENNLKKWKDFFDSQAIYPEIFDAMNSEYLDTGYGTGYSVDNTRFVHMNRWINSYQSLAETANINDANSQLGWGGYYYPRSRNVAIDQEQLCSLLLPLYFDPAQKDTYYANPNTDKGEFTYGCFSSDGSRIVIHPTKHSNWVNASTRIQNELFTNGNPYTEAGRKIGFDMHFSAPGMYYLLPLAGWAKNPNPLSSYASDIGDYLIPDNQMDGKTTGGEKYDMLKWQKLLYIGADRPLLNWDGTHFGFSGLHTAMNRGNDISAGVPLFPTIKTDDDASDVVYKINMFEHYNDFTPDRTPYDQTVDLYSQSTFGSSTFKWDKTNKNLERFLPYDQLSGIMISDFGVDEDLWEDSLWGLLGFTYDQFHASGTNRLTRIQSGNVASISYLTTNAEIVEGDTKIMSTNQVGSPIYNGMITTPSSVRGFNASQTAVNSLNQIYGEIVHKTQSMIISAVNLPTRMIRGYYTIRSNILEGTPFIGGKVNNTTMPIIGIVDKINGDGDFYFGQEGSLEFTITKSLRLASLTIGIHDPDGSYARTSEQSTILFKVQKPVVNTFNVVKEILEENPKEGKAILQRMNPAI